MNRVVQMSTASHNSSTEYSLEPIPAGARATARRTIRGQAGIWLDGIAVPRSGDASAFRCEELYDMIHSLQPHVLVGRVRAAAPIAGVAGGREAGHAYVAL